MRQASRVLKAAAASVDAIAASWAVQGPAGDAAVVIATGAAGARTAALRQMLWTALAGLLVLPLLLATILPVGSALALGTAGAAVPLLTASLLAFGGSIALAGVLLLVAAAVAIVMAAAVSGALTSPFVLLLALLPLETALYGRSRRGGLLGLAAAGCALAALALIAPRQPAAPSGAAAVLATFGLVAGYLLARVGLPAERRRKRPCATLVADSGCSPAATLGDLPGLVILVDARGCVAGVYGRDVDGIEQRLGRSLKDRDLLAQIHVGDRLRFAQALDRMRQGADTVSDVVRLPQASSKSGGQFIHLRLDMAVRRDGSGRIIDIVAALCDVSDAVEAETGAEDSATAAGDAHRTKIAVLAAASHELRTPLNAIIGFADALDHGCFGPLSNERQRECVGLIRQSGGHLLSVVNAMLDISKIEAGRYELDLEPFQIGEVVSACEAMLALQAHKNGVQLVSQVDRRDAVLRADRRTVHQMLINLVANAIKFTGTGGVVTIATRTVDQHLQLSVSDTGIGMSAEQLARIGEPFVQGGGDVSRKGEGSGLGLCLVQALAALHGGEVSIDSAIGRGTVVTVSLPVAGPKAPAAPARGGTDATIAFAAGLHDKTIDERLERGRRHDTPARTA